MMSATAPATPPGDAVPLDAGARWCRAASRARRSATLTGRLPLPMPMTLQGRPAGGPGRAGYGRNVISFRHPGTVLTDRLFAVPLDHGRPDGEQIEIFAREVVAAGQAGADLPWLVFLQGGPGFGAQRPEG